MKYRLNSMYNMYRGGLAGWVGVHNHPSLEMLCLGLELHLLLLYIYLTSMINDNRDLGVI